MLIFSLALAAPAALAAPQFAISNNIVDDGGVGSADVGTYTSTVVDADGNPVISYYDQTNQDLKLARCNDPLCASPATINIVDGVNAQGGFTSLALDSAGNPVIAYHDWQFGQLKLARCVDPVCATPITPQVVDTGGSDTVGQYVSMERQPGR